MSEEDEEHSPKPSPRAPPPPPPPTLPLKRPHTHEDEDEELLDPKRSKYTDHGAGPAGSSCHQCKSRRSHHDLIFCTHVGLDKKNKGCRKKYCEQCLKKFYQEDPEEIPDRTRWSCPSCRKLCCCAACRRKDQKDRPAQFAFDNSLPYFPHTLGSGSLPEGLAESAAASIADNSSNNTLHSERNTFGLLFAVAQMPAVQRLINDILARKDINDAEKVESIATLLRGALTNASGDNEAPTSSNQ